MALAVGREIRNLANIPRWSIIRTIRQQYVAEHSYYVAQYARRYAIVVGNYNPDYDHKVFRLRCIEAAMDHDISEILTGDIAGPSKRYMFNEESKKSYHAWEDGMLKERFPWYVEETSPEVRMVVSVCDYLEAFCYLLDEKALGNTNVHSVYEVNYPMFERKMTAADELLDIPAGTTKQFCEAVLREIQAGPDKAVL